MIHLANLPEPLVQISRWSSCWGRHSHQTEEVLCPDCHPQYRLPASRLLRDERSSMPSNDIFIGGKRKGEILCSSDSRTNENT